MTPEADRRATPLRRRADLEQTAQRARRDRRHRRLTLVLIAAAFVLAAVSSYSLLFVLPKLRSVQAAQVCAYRSAAIRESRLANGDEPAAVRRAHRQSADTFRVLADVSADGDTIHCKPLLQPDR